jgi:UDPglucose 6-dehydrogenase
LGSELAGRRVAILQAAFTPDTDDIRDSPALAVARGLADAGAEVALDDPRAGANVPLADPALDVATSPFDAAGRPPPSWR